jgi:hypothetical protein
MNFAFIVYAKTQIEPINNTQTENNTNPEAPPPQESSFLDQILAVVNGMIRNQSEYIMVVVGIGLVMIGGGTLIVKLKNARYLGGRGNQ